MVFIEMVTAWGHVGFNDFYLRAQCRDRDSLIVPSSLKEDYKKFSPLCFPDASSSLISRIVASWRILKMLPKTQDKTVCFLSYDLLMMPWVSFFLRLKGWKLCAFEHNTIPTSWVGVIFQRLIGKKVKHLTLSPMVEKRFMELGLSSCLVGLPLLDRPAFTGKGSEIEAIKKRSKGFDAVVFSPSGSVSWSELREVVKAHPNYLFVVKSSEKIEEPNVQSFEYIEDYHGVIDSVDAVYIPLAKEYRVSGPLFDAVGLGKRVIVKDNDFGRFAHGLFPEQVSFVFSLVGHSPVPPLDVESYNKTISIGLQRAFDRI